MLSRVHFYQRSLQGIFRFHARNSYRFTTIVPNSTRKFTTRDSDKGGSEDPFGVKYEDGEDNLGKELPPNYVRDKATGKFTGEIVNELTSEEEELLSMDDSEKSSLLVERLKNLWEGDKDGKLSDAVSEQIAKEETELNTFGRSPESQTARGNTEDGEDAYFDKTGFSQPLTPDEFRSFSRFMEKEHNLEISESDNKIPTLNMKDTLEYQNDENPDLDLAWMSAAARRDMEGEEGAADPFADLMPHDLNPTRLVNRRRAKRIPKELLHHNNLSLLRRYITPTGQIMNRAQSRLGAKDQRKVAKLIKRARAMGLIPYVGQWKHENHGNKFENDIHKDKGWERELARRGLSINHNQFQTSETSKENK